MSEALLVEVPVLIGLVNAGGLHKGRSGSGYGPSHPDGAFPSRHRRSPAGVSLHFPYLRDFAIFLLVHVAFFIQRHDFATVG
jgi:hypothetical protein